MMIDRLRSLGEKYAQFKVKSKNVAAAALMAPNIVSGVQIPLQTELPQRPAAIVVQQELPNTEDIITLSPQLETPVFSIASEALKKAKVEEINKKITATREKFLEEVQSTEKAELTYNYEHDQKPYQTLATFRHDTTGAYEEVRTSLDSFTHFQLDTMLRERFGALASKWKLRINEGSIYSEFNKAEPFRNTLIRGQQYRERHGSTEIRREKAEVEGLVSVTEPVLTNPHTPLDTSVLVLSLPGRREKTPYRKNFYDIFTVKVHENGERYIEAKRYSSALKGNEYKEHVKIIHPEYPFPDAESEDGDTLLLAMPIVTTYSSEAIHQLIHKDHKVTKEEKMEYILKGIEFFKQRFVDQLHENPDDEIALKRRFNAILNAADRFGQEYDDPKVRKEGRVSVIFEAREISQMETQKVREVMTDCGKLTGFAIDPLVSPLQRQLQQLQPYSVADFAMEEEDQFGPLEFECPHAGCKKTNKRPKGKLIPNCQHCGKSVKC